MALRVTSLTVVCALGVAAWLAWSTFGVQAQQEGGEQPPQTPPLDLAALKQSWSAMSAAEFVESARATLKTSRGGLKNDSSEEAQSNHRTLRKAVDAEALRRLLDTNTAAQDPLPVVSQLLKWTFVRLTNEQQTTIKQKLGQRAEQIPSLGMDDLAQLYQLREWSGSYPGEAEEVIRTWLAGRDLSLVPVPDLEWCCFKLTSGEAGASQNLSVRWTGSVRAPQDGEYTFFASPLRIGLQTEFETIRSSMQVSIGGQQVLDTNVDGPKGKPVTLTAQTATPIRVDFRYESSKFRVNSLHPPIAMLYWEGPGVERQLVPSSALIPSEGEGNGLLGEYHQTRYDGKPDSDKRIDPQIDFLWTTGDSFFYHDNEKSSVWKEVVQALVNQYTKPQYLSEWLHALEEQPSRDGEQMIDLWARMTELMTSAQRAQLLQAIMGRQDLVSLLPHRQMSRTYQFFRAGSERQAVDFVGKWMQANLGPRIQFSRDYFSANRARAFHVGNYVGSEYPEGRQLLEDNYLQYPDGRCCLWVAYTLAYAHAFQGELNAWIDKLNARLADGTLTGDKRVDWLLARAQAEEIRGGVARRFTMQPENYDAGWGWLDEASLAAQTDAVGLQTFREKLTRVAADDRRWQLPTILEQASTRYTSASSRVIIDSWKEQIAYLAKQFDAAQLQQTKESQKAYIDELKRRLANAEGASEQDEVGRYQQLISQAEAALEAQSAESPTPPAEGQPAGGSP